MKVALIISYDGTDYFGSQIQKETSLTILGTLTHIFEKLGVHDKIIASGRTDKGVHATGQVCHITLPSFWDDLQKLQRTLNTMLPNTIFVKKIYPVSTNFHARYGAKKRVYRYILKQGSADPFLSRFIAYEKKISFQDIQKNIQLFQGKYDFAYFMKQGSDTTSTQREIYNAFAYKHKDTIVLYFEANGFLRTQIRFMVGALLQLNAQQILEKLTLKINHKVKPAKPQGLYLAKISY